MNFFKKFFKELAFSLRQRYFLRENTWQGIVPGTKLRYKGKNFLYVFVNKHGGPGMYGRPEPMFCEANTSWEGDPRSVFYIRQIGEQFPEKVFGENRMPMKAGSVFIGFLNASVFDFQIVGK